MTRVRRFVLVLLALLCALAPRPATAHGRSLSYSSWKFTGDGALVRVRIPRLELTRLALDPVLEPHKQPALIRLLAEQVRLSSRGQPCAPAADPFPVAAPDGWVVYEWTLKCADPGAPVVSSTLLLDVAPSHLHFARVEMPDGSVREAVLSEAQTSWSLGELGAECEHSQTRAARACSAIWCSASSTSRRATTISSSCSRCCCSRRVSAKWRAS